MMQAMELYNAAVDVYAKIVLENANKGCDSPMDGKGCAKW